MSDLAVQQDVYLTSVDLLCAQCKAPIQGRITSPQWIRVEYIGPNGECRSCSKRNKQKGSEDE